MMTALNRDILGSTEGSRYATLVHALLEPASGAIRYVNAGHPAPLVIGPAGAPIGHGAVRAAGMVTFARPPSFGRRGPDRRANAVAAAADSPRGRRPRRGERRSPQATGAGPLLTASSSRGAGSR